MTLWKIISFIGTFDFDIVLLLSFFLGNEEDTLILGYKGHEESA